MKKIIVIFVSLLTLVCFVAPSVSYADNAIIEDISTLDFYSFEHFESVFGFDSDLRYLEFQALWHDTGNSSGVYNVTFGFKLSESDFQGLNITQTGTQFNIDFGDDLTYYECYHYFSFDHLNFDDLTAISPTHSDFYCNDGTKPVSSRPTVRRVAYDFRSRSLILYRSDDSIFYSMICKDMHTNFDDLNLSEIQVSIYPKLDYNFDYQVDFMGDSVPINLIQVDITNHSDRPYQYAILIQPEGSFLEFEEHSNSRNLGVFWGDSSVTYALFKDEWFYAPVNFSQGYELINAPCPWHFIAATQFKREQIYFDQMKLKAGENYTFKVLAYDLSNSTYNDHACATAAASIKTVFSKNFSVKSDTVFNPDSDANGAYSFDNEKTLDEQFDVLKAIYNKDTGEVNPISNGTFSNVYKKTTSNGSSSFSSGSSSSFDNLLIYSASYLVLCRRVLYYFPDWVLALLLAALSGLVLIFILKKL